MQNVFNVIQDLLQMTSITGVYKNVIVSFVLTIAITFSVIVVGYIMNQFEKWQMKLLSKVFGDGLSNFICNRLTFVGTMIHECSHALFAVLTGAKVTKIKCFTLFNKNELGYVEFSTRGCKLLQMLQLALVSCAPVITGLPLITVLISVLVTHSYPIIVMIIGWYLVVSILDHMSMSMVDISNYCRGLLLIAPCMFGIFMMLQYLQ